MIRKALIFVVFGLVMHNLVLAQEANFLPFLTGVSQSSTLNPAIQNKTDKIVIGVPGLSGIQFGWNSNFAFNSLFYNGFSYSFSNLYDDLKEQGKGRYAANVNIFYSSFKVKKWNLSFAVSEKAYATTNFDRDIVKIIRDGNQGYFGKTENFGNGSFNFEHYREVAFGFSYRYWKELDFGIRPKILFGRFYFDVQDVNVSVDSDMENRELHLTPAGSFNLSAPLSVNYDSISSFTRLSANVLPGDYFFSPRNLGFAIDLGFVYRPNKLYEIAASISDLGFIGFKHNTFNVDFVDPIQYPEKKLYQSVVPGDRYKEPREALKTLGDSISYIINANYASQRIFSLTPFKINVSGKYKVSKSLEAGIADVFTYYGTYSANYLTGFLHKTYNQKFELASSLTLYNISSVWLGLGGSYTSNLLQFYFSSNNILGIIRPGATKNLNLCLGINLLFETKKR